MRRYQDQDVQTSRCTIAKDDGTFCDAPGSQHMPFPICFDHGMRLYRSMQAVIEGLQAGARYHYANLPRVQTAKTDKPTHCVYYIRVGDLIKIGTTTHLYNRLSAYPPGTRILAIEPGGHVVENLRHEQFKHLLAERNEWFHPGPDLVDHIRRLAQDGANG